MIDFERELVLLGGARLPRYEFQDGVVGGDFANRQILARRAVGERVCLARGVRILGWHQYMQPCHPNFIHLVVQQAGITGANDESLGRDERREILTLTMQELQALCYAAWREVRDPELCDLHVPGEAIL